MKKFAYLLLVILILAVGCTATVEPTAEPVNPNVKVSPPSQATPTPPPASTSNCQSKLTGRVYDAKGALAKGAVIEIKSGSFTGKTLSDDNGLYGFAGLCAGTYNFTVQLAGQAAKPLSSTATVNGGDSAKVDLTVK